MTELGRRPSEGRINVWRLIAGHESPSAAAAWSAREGIIAVGWATGDLRERTAWGEAEIANLARSAHPTNHSSNIANAGRSLWRMYQVVQVGDLVIIVARKRVLTMRVTGDYYYIGGEYTANTPHYEHRRKAEVVPIDPDRLWESAGGRASGENVYSTLIRCSNSLTTSQYEKLLGK